MHNFMCTKGLNGKKFDHDKNIYFLDITHSLTTGMQENFHDECSLKAPNRLLISNHNEITFAASGW